MKKDVFAVLGRLNTLPATASLLAVLLVFTAMPSVAADKKPAATAPANKKPIIAAPADKTKADESEESADSKKAISDAKNAAAAKRREEIQEAAKKGGWILGPVKDKSELPPFKMIYIKRGCFDMGDWSGEGDDDEKPVHNVCLSNYYIAETEVTQKLWVAVMGGNPSTELGADKPISNVMPIQIKQFLIKLNKLTNGYYRLPTEAEWEYAARSNGKKERWAGADNEEVLGDYAWFADNSDGALKPVKQKKPNGLGLYDMTGSVWEMTEDFFDFDYYGRSSQRDPLNMEYTTWTSIRGGSILDEPFKTRTTYRFGIEPGKTSATFNIGFRLAE